MTDRNIYFVSRLGKNFKHTISRQNVLEDPVQKNTLYIQSDEWIYLYNQKQKPTQHSYRCIEAVSMKNNKPISFITNIADLNTEEITELYKKRWDIEVFFKSLKQHLNFSHLISRSVNGIKVTMYISLIAAILILMYKKMNNLKGSKLVKMKFAQELEKYIIRDIVQLTGGSTEKFDMLFKINSS